MAVRFATDKSGRPTGGLQSYDHNVISFGGKTFRGGGGGSSPSPTNAQAEAQRQAEQQAEAQRQAEQQAEAQRIEKERQKAIFEANRNYQSNLRNIHDQAGRQAELNKLQENISKAQANAQLQRVEKGIATSTTFISGGYSEAGKYIPREEIKVRGGETQRFREQYLEETTPQTKVQLELNQQQVKDYISKPIKYQNEVYFGGKFVSESPTGRGSTAYVRQPTPEEIVKMDTTKGVTKYIFGEKLSENLLTANIQDLENRYEKTEGINKELTKVTKELSELEKKGDTEGYNKKYREYETLVLRFQNVGGKVTDEGFKQPEIKTGLFGLYVKRDIGELGWIRNIEKKPVTSIVKPIALTTGGLLGGFFRENLPEQGIYQTTTPERNINLSLPYQVRGTMVSEGTKFITPTTNIIIPEKTTKYLTSAQGEWLGKTIGDISPYFIPKVGAGLFYGENIERLGQNIYEQKKVTKGTLEWFKESPIESTIAVGIPLFMLGKYGASKLRLTKQGKYLNQPELKIVDVTEKEVKNVIREQRNIPTTKIIQEDNLLKISVAKKLKGSLTTNEFFPTGELSGSVTEVRDVGKVGISWIKGDTFLSSKVRIGKNIKEFKGDVSIVDDIYREVIPYTKDITKITTIEKTGKGTVELFKRGELISSQKVETGIDFLKNFKTKTNKLTFEGEQFNPLTITETKLNERIIGKNIKDELGNEVVFFNAKPNLKSAKVTGQIESKVTKAQDLTSGQFSLRQDVSAFSDIIKSNERLGFIQLKAGRGNLIVKKVVGTEIVYGADKDVDKLMSVTRGGKTKSIKIINPNIERQIVEGSQSRFISGYINPQSKNIKNLIRIKEEKINKMLDVLKKDRVEQFNIWKAEQLKKGIKTKPKGVITNEIVNIKTPSYVGGQGGEGTESLYAFDSRSAFNIPKEVYVEPPSSYLRGTTPRQANIPINIISTDTTKIAKEIEFGKVFPLGKFDVTSDLKVSQVPIEQVKLNVMQELKIKQEPKFETKQLSFLGEGSKTEQQPKELQKEIQLTKQLSLLKQEQQSKQRQKQIQRLTQEFKQKQREPKKPTFPKTPLLKLPSSQLSRIAKRTETEPELFEAIGFRFGKEVSIKKGTKEETSRALSGFLKGTLGASGYLKSGEFKLKAEETGLLRDFGFRKSKVSPFLVVEEKSRRLKKGRTGEVQEIQYFRKQKSKKSLF